jgi:hypothetical protein
VTFVLALLVAGLGGKDARGFGGGESYADLAVESDSVVAIEGLQHTIGAWFRYTFLTLTDCSPPPSCYAKSQRVYYFINCATGAVMQVQRISLDLNGGVVAQTEPDFNAPWYFPRVNSRERIGVLLACTSPNLRSALPLAD